MIAHILPLKPTLSSKRRFLAILGNLMLLLLIVPLHGPGSPTPSPTPQTTTAGYATPDSAGYIANYTSSANSVDQVKADWKVPTVQTSSARQAVLESIGIGTGDTIIQVGTSQVSHNGAIVYEAWYYVAPESGGGVTHITTLDGKVSAGTIVRALIQRDSVDNWTIAMLVGTTNSYTGSFLTNIVHAAGQPIADWLVQTVDTSTPLANFGSAAFLLTNATIDGTQSRLDKLQNQRLDLVDSTTRCNLATTGDIDPAYGDSFIVSFVASSGPCTTQAPSAPSISPLIVVVVAATVVAGIVALVAVAVVLSLRKKGAVTSPYGLQSTSPPPQMTRFCVNCHSPLQAGARFCDICGHQV